MRKSYKKCENFAKIFNEVMRCFKARFLTRCRELVYLLDQNASGDTFKHDFLENLLMKLIFYVANRLFLLISQLFKSFIEFRQF